MSRHDPIAASGWTLLPLTWISNKQDHHQHLPFSLKPIWIRWLSFPRAGLIVPKTHWHIVIQLLHTLQIAKNYVLDLPLLLPQCLNLTIHIQLCRDYSLVVTYDELFLDLSLLFLKLHHWSSITVVICRQFVHTFHLCISNQSWLR